MEGSDINDGYHDDNYSNCCNSNKRTCCEDEVEEKDSTAGMVPFKKTLSFSENSLGWVSFKSFLPESGVSLNNNYYTFKNGDMYKHHANETRNFFYGLQYDSSIDVLFNDVSEAVKSFSTISYEGSQARYNSVKTDEGGLTTGEYYNLNPRDGWYVSNVVTDLQTCDYLEFKNKEGKYFTHVKGDTTSLSNLDEKEFSVQGIGILEEVDFESDDQGPVQTCLDIYPIAVCNEVYGCTNPEATNYDPTATIDDGSCEIGKGGCTDVLAINWDSTATFDDGSCEYVAYGCQDPTATNYDPTANADDPEDPCTYSCDPEPYVEYYGAGSLLTSGAGMEDASFNMLVSNITSPFTSDPVCWTDDDCTVGELVVTAGVNANQYDFSFNELSSGTYQGSITDANGCTFNFGPMIINDPADPEEPADWPCYNSPDTLFAYDSDVIYHGISLADNWLYYATAGELVLSSVGHGHSDSVTHLSPNYDDNDGRKWSHVGPMGAQTQGGLYNHLQGEIIHSHNKWKVGIVIGEEYPVSLLDSLILANTVGQDDTYKWPTLTYDPDNYNTYDSAGTNMDPDGIRWHRATSTVGTSNGIFVGYNIYRYTELITLLNSLYFEIPCEDVASEGRLAGGKPDRKTYGVASKKPTIIEKDDWGKKREAMVKMKERARQGSKNPNEYSNAPKGKVAARMADDPCYQFIFGVWDDHSKGFYSGIDLTLDISQNHNAETMYWYVVYYIYYISSSYAQHPNHYEANSFAGAFIFQDGDCCVMPDPCAYGSNCWQWAFATDIPDLHAGCQLDWQADFS